MRRQKGAFFKTSNLHDVEMQPTRRPLQKSSPHQSWNNTRCKTSRSSSPPLEELGGDLVYQYPHMGKKIAFWFVFHATDWQVPFHPSVSSFYTVLMKSLHQALLKAICMYWVDPTIPATARIRICTKRKSGIASLRNQKLHKIAHRCIVLVLVSDCACYWAGSKYKHFKTLCHTSHAPSVHIARTREHGPPEYFQGYWPVRRKWSHSLHELVLQSSRRLKSSVLPQVKESRLD